MVWVTAAVLFAVALAWLISPLTRPAVEAGQLFPQKSLTARMRRNWVMGLAAFSTLLTLGLYVAVGAPEQPSAPFRDGAAMGNAQNLSALIGAAETKLLKNPDDVRGWAALAPAYAELGDYERARAAYEEALRRTPQAGGLLAGYGEMLVAQAGGIVTAEAEALLRRALDAEPGLIMPRYYIGLARSQDGDALDALAIWEKLLVDVT